VLVREALVQYLDNAGPALHPPPHVSATLASSG